MTEDATATADRLAKSFGPEEAGIEKLALALIRADGFAVGMGWSEITRFDRQVQLGKSVADIVLHHVDGSVTIVEVKRGGLGLRDYCTGIGQLFYQSIMAMSVYQTFTVRRVLALPWKVSTDLALAAMHADVEILPLPSQEEWRNCLKEAAEEIRAASAIL